MMSLGLRTLDAFGWAREIRCGLIKRLSKVFFFPVLIYMSSSCWCFVNFIYCLTISLQISFLNDLLISALLLNWEITEFFYRLKLKGVYMYAAGFYTYSIFALMFWETRRADFGVSMGHHVATVILIVLSYIFRFALIQFCYCLLFFWLLTL